MIKGKASNKTAVIKKRRRTPVGSRNESPDSPSVILPHQRTIQLQNFSPSTPVSPISPGTNFVLFAQQHLDKQKLKQNEPTTPTTPTTPIFDPNMNTMPCWNQLQSSIQNLPATVPAAPLAVNTKKRKIDTSTTTTTKKKKSRTMTTITTTTTHRLNTAGIDALMGAVAEQRKEEIVPHLDLHITTTLRKGKQTYRKMNADARSAAIHASSTDTPTTPTFFSPPLFATTMTTTTTTVVPNPDNAVKSAASLTEEQFYQYQQLIMQQQAGPSLHQEDGELSNDSSGSSASASSSVSNTKPPVTILQNTFGSVDKLGNFYGSFNETDKQPETSPYGMLMDGDEDYEVIAAQRRPQKRTRTSPPKKVTTTTTLTMTTTVSSAPVKSKRVRDRMVKKRVNYAGASSGTEDSDYEPEVKFSKWEAAAKALNVSLEDAHSALVHRFPKAPVLKKMGSLWAICEVIRVHDQRSE
jgi:hypothetical protein